MTTTSEAFFPEFAPNDLGTISVRVVVLPRKIEEIADDNDEVSPLDLTDDEMLPEEGSSPVASYLERPKTGKLCCVFLVNGQRHEGLDNSFIVQQLGFKYLRKRMMVIVDVDGMKQEALGSLMQGSRQGFFKGQVWEAISSRLVATLKGDPELKKLEEEAEAEVSQLEAGDQKVKDALDNLIESHHQHADHVVLGKGGEAGPQNADGAFGTAGTLSDSLVSLLSPDQGQPSDFPVLVSTPDTTSLWLKPGVERSLVITSQPANAWPALANFEYTLDIKIPELHIAEERSETTTTLTLRFDPPDDFDTDDYPLRTTLRVFARFNGFKEPRQLAIGLTMKPVVPPAEPELFDDPSFIKVSTRQPVRLWMGAIDTHVRVRWNGKDDVVLGASPFWTFKARCLTPAHAGLSTTFSQPRKGRFSLLVSLPPQAELGEELSFEIVATGPNGKTLTTTFDAVIAERTPRPEPEPRLITGNVPSGAARRPPYELKYIERAKWDNGTCFGGENWTADNVGAYQEPTETQPLILVINKDMAVLETYRNYLVSKKIAESDIKNRLQKYNSHVYFHLYQMYQAATDLAAQATENQDDDAPRPPKPHEQRAEIRRVGMTLLNLMQVAH